jgi:hypothetical protein
VRGVAQLYLEGAQATREPPMAPKVLAEAAEAAMHSGGDAEPLPQCGTVNASSHVAGYLECEHALVTRRDAVVPKYKSC